jgi:hypothetical protein
MLPPIMGRRKKRKRIQSGRAAGGFTVAGGASSTEGGASEMGASRCSFLTGAVR